ncbi:Alpha/beta hydrolase fold-1 [Microdochium trichocladiopsis]|uniref:Alpha/beta hydrolase fold-1 n=1 Tax=Microdochium trichocladiopsis TaxID=1682393 RepID=A0A9P9BJH6_9PEZI|nr:Alpha/beta hydrolase fold-1 [Microdochium trichocladiopsis]KAH7018105.1 Alpha/beta hydrolase fold-1 [Microdochium trichocladiopsis]
MASENAAPEIKQDQGDDKPVILLVHGSWHSPKVYDKVRAKLTELGYESHAPRLPSLGDQPKLSWRVDVAAIHDWAIPLFEAGKKVILVAHSLSGVTATIAVQNQTTSARAAAGLKGGFHAAVFLCAFVAPQAGVDVITLFGGVWPPWSIPDEKYTGGTMRVNLDMAAQTLYSDLPEQEAADWVAALLPNSQATVETTIPVSAGDVLGEGKIDCLYVLCTSDKTIAPGLQEVMAGSIPGAKVERIDASHSPMLSRPDEVAKLVVSTV